MIPTAKAKNYDVADALTLQHYLQDHTTPFCGIMSHVRSGKTSAMMVKSQLIAINQHPSEEGVRHTRQLFVRGTTADLLRATVRSFTDWLDEKQLKRGIRRTTPIGGQLEMYPLNDQLQHFPEHMFIKVETEEGETETIAHPYMLGGRYDERSQTYVGGTDVSGHLIGDYFPHGTFVDAYFDFVPLDNTEWEQTLLGTEYTCASLDEPDSMSNIRDVLTKVPGRLGRYPSVTVAPIVTCDQVNLSFNPAPENSFMQDFFAKKNEHLGRKLYRVPPPFVMKPDRDDPDNFFKAQFKTNPDAEGLNFTNFSFWRKIIDANRHDPNKIRRDVLGQWTRGSGGALIHPTYNRKRHVVNTVMPQRQYKLFCSLDPGLGGAAIFAQCINGSLKVIEEMASDGMATFEFSRQIVIPHIQSQYRGYDIIVTGDPTGDFRGKDSGVSSYSIFEDMGYLVEVNRDHIAPELRWSAVNSLLNYQDGLQIAEECHELIRGFEGEYVFKTNRQGQSLRQADKTNPITAYQDCLQAIACLIWEGYEEAASTSWDPYHTSGGYSDNRDVGDDPETFLWA